MNLLSDIPPYPQYPLLKAEGKRRWDWYCKMLLDNNRLAEAFLPTIEEVCRLHDEIFDLRKEFEAQKTISKGKSQVVYTRTSRKPNPLIAEIRAHSKELTKLQDKLGCSPAAARNHNLPVNLPLADPPKPGSHKTARPTDIDEDFE